MMRFSPVTRLWITRFTILLLAAAALVAVQSARQPAPPARAATSAAGSAASTGAPPHLLLIHGYTDSCYAFNDPGTGASGFDTSTIDYLTGSTPGEAGSQPYWPRSDIQTVGYYTQDYGSAYDGGGDTGSGTCDVNLNGSDAGSWANDTVNCNLDWQESTLPPGNGDPFGTEYDPIMHLACLLAWYIYDTYTRTGQPVEILAHSMGGLITRAAIGGSSSGAAGFPPALLVPDVVAVATPQGGIGGVEWLGAQWPPWFGNQDTQELKDMTPNSLNSDFMSRMGQGAYEKPQGTGGTHWALIGSSVPAEAPTVTASTFDPLTCADDIPNSSSWSMARALSYAQWCVDSDKYPDGDGVVNAESQLAMRADYKVLYGQVEDINDLKLYADGSTTYYEHEDNTGELGYSTQPPFYLNDGANPSTSTRAFVCSSNCTATDFSDLNLNAPASVPHSLAEIASQLRPPQKWVTGHAVNAGDDYPYETAGQFGHTAEGTDAWNEYYGQCDSFAAWKVYENLAGSSAQHPSGSIPALGWTPSNASVSPVNQFTWGPNGGKYGNADVWASKFASLGYAVDGLPAPGSIAWWPNAVTDPQDGNPPDPSDGIAGSSTGHVGFVSDVYPDGSITIENYNLRENGEYSVIHLNYRQGTSDASFGQSSMNVPWPDYFIHVADGPSGQPSPPEPSAGVVQAGYPGQPSAYSGMRPGLAVVGPGDGGSDFALAGSAYPNSVHGWYPDTGHGEIGQMQWTNSHPGAADSTATWSPATLSAGACYEVDAFVPDNWSNNDAALYSVSDGYFGTSLVPVDENDLTNQWAELGVFQARSDGSLPVQLTDQGDTGGQVAADTMRYVQQPTCSQRMVRASQTIDDSNGMQLAGQAYAGTVDGWYADSGGGQLGHQYWTYTNGMTPGSSATWLANVIPNACYELFAYVPDSHSNDYQAQYTISSALGSPVVSVDENAYTDTFAPLGTYQSTSAGRLAVTLSDQSPASGDAYITADTVSFVHAPCPAVTEGSTYPALTAGPGSPLASFSLANDWYSNFGAGDLGYEKWTHTNGSTAVSTATWTFTGLAANTTYFVCAYIPHGYANNTAAHYQGFAGSGTTAAFTTSLNQANLTGWSPLGSITTNSARTAHVTLDDTGPTGTYTAADAMRLATSGC